MEVVLLEQRVNPCKGWILRIYRLFGDEVEESKTFWQLGKGGQSGVDRVTLGATKHLEGHLGQRLVKT